MIKQQLHPTPLHHEFFRQFLKWPLIVLMVIACLGAAIPSVAQTGSTQLRVGHFVLDAPAVNLYVDDAAILGNDNAPSIFSPMTLPDQYLDFAADAHTFMVAADGDTQKSALIPAESFTLEVDHHYLLAILGNAGAGDLHFRLIDETAEIEKMDINKSAVSIIVNNINGIPAVDGSLGGKPFFTNLAYGAYIVAQDPTEGQGTQINAHNDPASMLFEFPEAVGSPANIFAVFAFSGKYPGTVWEDYTAYYVGQYVGQLSVTDGGVIAVGDSVPVTFTGMGQRVRYTLTLDTKTSLDIVEAMNDVTSGADAYLRINNAAGDTLYESDEVSMDDNDQGIYDAGWKGLTLEAGAYTLEAATFADTGSGDFTISVSLAQ